MEQDRLKMKRKKRSNMYKIKSSMSRLLNSIAPVTLSSKSTARSHSYISLDISVRSPQRINTRTHKWK